MWRMFFLSPFIILLLLQLLGFLDDLLWVGCGESFFLMDSPPPLFIFLILLWFLDDF
jgi:hypothetical protein